MGRSLSRVLREDADMPSPAFFWTWHMHDDDIKDNLARARQNGVEALLDEAVDIANTPQIGEVTVTKPGSGDDATDKVEVRREDMLGHRKLQVETRIKVAQMIAPRKYGPKVDVTSDNKPLAGFSAGDMAARVASLMDVARARREAAGDDAAET